jgi:cytoskeletal protein RodZ
MTTDEVGPPEGHTRGDDQRRDSAGHLVESNSNGMMVVFLLGTAVLLAVVSVWVFARFSPQALRFTFGGSSSRTDAGHGPTAHPGAPPATTPSAAPIALPPPGWPGPVATPTSPHPKLSTTPPITTLINLPLPVTQPAPSSGRPPPTSGTPGPTSSGPSVPDVPINVVASVSGDSVTLVWTAPLDGGSPIVSYTITPYLVTTGLAPITVTGAPPVTTVTLTGLPDASVGFTVTAVNAVGASAESIESNTVTPVVTATPAAPSTVAATAGSGSATVVWTLPADGGSAITSYVITPYLAGVAQTPVTIDAASAQSALDSSGQPAVSATVAGLASDTYTFTVAAINAVGEGGESVESNAVNAS